MKASCGLAAFTRITSVPASSQFMLKVSPKNNGSAHLVAGTEELAPGAAIAKHRHLAQDEIVLLHSGKAHVWLGDQERDPPCGRTCVYSGEYLDKFEEHWHRTDPPDFHLLSAGIRGYDAMQFRAGRRNAHPHHASAAKRLCTPGPCRKREQARIGRAAPPQSRVVLATSPALRCLATRLDTVQWRAAPPLHFMTTQLPSLVISAAPTWASPRSSTA